MPNSKQGIQTATDGSQAVVWVETAVTQGACAYPITPSSDMGQGYQLAVSNGKKNLWDEPLSFLELESEHSSASSCEGFALAGGRVSNFTSGQGLILMKEVLYTLSGKRLPCVFHIGARALTSQSLNIHAGHDDVMGVADCGWGMIFAKNVQEACDFALISRRAAEDTCTPFMNIQDGFLTTHTIEDVFLPAPQIMKTFLGHPSQKLMNLMDPQKAWMSGVVQNQDSYMKGKWAQRFYYDDVVAALKSAMDEYGKLTGHTYDLVEPYRLEDADYAIVGLGSAIETAMETVDFLRKHRKIKIGALNVRTYRPFPAKEIVQALKKVKCFTVIERLDIPLMGKNPLTLEIEAAFFRHAKSHPKIYSAVYGLGGRDTRPEDFVACLDLMTSKKSTDVTYALGIPGKHALERPASIDIRSPHSFSMRGHSIGGFGSVTTNKIIATVSQNLFGLHVQAFPKYGSEKRGLPTQYFLTLSNQKVRTHCELEHVDLVILNDLNAFYVGNPLKGLSMGGHLFIQTSPKNFQTLWETLPQNIKTEIRKKEIHLWVLDAKAIASELSPSPAMVQRMQGIVILGVFLKITPFTLEKGLSGKNLFDHVEKAVEKYFGRKGKAIVETNMKCIERGFHEVCALEIPK
ncbi:MAG: pyruvate ferredoxin oxidoreductase [Deltaproteobacteria bacterium RIFCSPHIGHO2_02_FULL_40_11]|nr:MAG: pyruvate ferredoxin oxidoreductase [Deltaproteobacteria bacterium RIFCSPHIGHO2_02_FULL_40_11]